jgi:hypothetical protein
MTTEMTTTSERPRYFPRQVITADDLTADQDYFRDKLRRHNRMLHGWGILCGTLVEAVKNSDGSAKPWFVKINPGYIIGPYGDEICIGKVVCCDLRIKCAAAVVTVATDPCADSITQAPPPAGGTFYVVIQYYQEAMRPVRLKASGCGCGENPCENSRYRDGYQICVLDTLPASHAPAPAGAPAPPALAPGVAPDCPPPPVDPWVVLARVTVDKAGAVGDIKFDDRRILTVHK